MLRHLNGSLGHWGVLLLTQTPRSVPFELHVMGIVTWYGIQTIWYDWPFEPGWLQTIHGEANWVIIVGPSILPTRRIIQYRYPNQIRETYMFFIPDIYIFWHIGLTYLVDSKGWGCTYAGLQHHFKYIYNKVFVFGVKRLLIVVSKESSWKQLLNHISLTVCWQNATILQLWYNSLGGLWCERFIEAFNHN